MAGGVLFTVFSSAKADSCIMSIFAGVSSNTGQYGGDNGPALSAKFNSPRSLYVRAGQQLMISDYSNNKVRKINMDTTQIALEAGGVGTYEEDIFIRRRLSSKYQLDKKKNDELKKQLSSGKIDVQAGRFSPYGGDGLPATHTSVGLTPTAVLTDVAGNLYLMDDVFSNIRKVGTNGIITLFAGQCLAMR